MNALSFVKNTLQGFVDHKQSFSEEEAVSWLVCNARSGKNPTTKKIGTGKTRFGHGQLPASIRYLARIFSWAFGKVRAFIRKLKKLGVITVHYKWCLPIITVNDYDNVVNDAAELKINPKLMAKQDRTPEEDAILDMFRNGGDRVSMQNLKDVVAWYEQETGQKL